MERVLWVALDFPCIAFFLYIVPGNIFRLSGRMFLIYDIRLDDIWSTCTSSPCTGNWHRPCSHCQPLFETWPQTRFSNGLWFIFKSMSTHIHPPGFEHDPRPTSCPAWGAHPPSGSPPCSCCCPWPPNTLRASLILCKSHLWCTNHILGRKLST